jgi:hypothetical protein
MTDKPMRVQLSRRRGWRMPGNTVKVDRSNRTYGNHIRILSGVVSAQEAVSRYGDFCHHALNSAWRAKARADLAGRNIACWCALCPEHKAGRPLGVTCDVCAPCHTDVLLPLVNKGEKP